MKTTFLGRGICAVAICSLCLPFAAAFPTPGQQILPVPDGLTQALNSLRRSCASLDGILRVQPGAISRHDLDGNLNPDWVLDSRFLSCSTSASLFCGGSGGCTTYFHIGKTTVEFLNQGWDLAHLDGRRVLLLNIHGSECGGSNPTPCIRALTWDAKTNKWRTPGDCG